MLKMADQRKGTGQPSNAARNAYAIDVEKFKTRLKVLYSNWNENKAALWGSSDAVAVATRAPSEDFKADAGDQNPDVVTTSKSFKAVNGDSFNYLFFG